MSLKSQMPWDALRGETIRLVIRELGFDYVGLRKDEMINYLHVVENTGCTLEYLYVCILLMYRIQ